MQKGMGWYRKAAAQGNTDAMVQLGNLYEQGRGVPKSGPEALSWYLKAAEKGNLDAQFRAGYIFLNGLEDVPYDYEQALKWFRNAAQQGSGEAELTIAALFQQGIGVDHDLPIPTGIWGLYPDIVAPGDLRSDDRIVRSDDGIVIGADDVVSVNVWNEPEISGTVSVRSDGKISLPLVGDIQASGLTPLQVQLAIEKKLESYQSERHVTVIVPVKTSEKSPQH